MKDQTGEFIGIPVFIKVSIEKVYCNLFDEN